MFTVGRNSAVKDRVTNAAYTLRPLSVMSVQSTVMLDTGIY